MKLGQLVDRPKTLQPISLLGGVDVEVELIGVGFADLDASENGADGGAQADERALLGPRSLFVQHRGSGEIAGRT